MASQATGNACEVFFVLRFLKCCARPSLPICLLAGCLPANAKMPALAAGIPPVESRALRADPVRRLYAALPYRSPAAQPQGIPPVPQQPYYGYGQQPPYGQYGQQPPYYGQPQPPYTPQQPPYAPPQQPQFGQPQQPKPQQQPWQVQPPRGDGQDEEK